MVDIDLRSFLGLDGVGHRFHPDIDPEFENFDVYPWFRPPRDPPEPPSLREWIFDVDDQRRNVLTPSVDLQYLSTPGSPGTEGE